MKFCQSRQDATEQAILTEISEEAQSQKILKSDEKLVISPACAKCTVEYWARVIEHCLSMIEHCPSMIEHCPSTIEHCPSMIEHCPSMIEHCSSMIEHCSSTIEHCSSILDHCSKNCRFCFFCFCSLSPRISCDLRLMAGF